MYYKISNGSVSLGGNTILENINFSICDKEKIGVVGRNGCGKTTLLKTIIGEVEFTDGYDLLKIEKTNNLNIGYAKQNIDNTFDIKMIDYIKDAYKDILSIEDKLSDLEDKMSNNYDEKVVIKYNKLLSEYEYLGGYTYKKEYEVGLKKFGFNDSDKEKMLSEFSGGQLTKLSLLKMVLSKPELLILDEPTNHLDISSIEWLEDYLKEYTKSIIIVSHDRMFLDNICNVIYEISYGELKRYNGNYTYFINKKEEDYQKQLKDYEIQQKEIKRLQEIADRFRYKPSKASMAMSKLKQIERMVKIDKPQKDNIRTFKTNFNPDIDSYKEVLKLKNLSIGYERELFNITLKLNKSDKLGIIGSNGCGKSTLLKTIMGEIKPLSGKYIFGDRVNIGYYSQKFENLNNDNTIFEEINSAFPKMPTNEIRNLLGAFDFSGDEVFKYIKDLSGGEKVRVSLCKILNSKHNLLILDEPTNHLDIINKNTIEKLLESYKGTIILVSHDRYLINKVCNKLLVFENNTTHLYEYGYNEYINSKNNSVKEKKTNININDIIKLENELKRLNSELLKEEVYLDVNKSSKIDKKIKELEEKIKILTEKWENMI